MMSDVLDFLTMTPGDIPESVTLPEGSYDFTITSYRSDKVGENQTPLVRMNCKAVGVIQSDLSDSDLQNAEPTRIEFWATPKAMQQNNPALSLKAFLLKGLEMDDTQSFSELLEQAIGQTFSGIVKHEMVGRNKDKLQASIKRIIKK